MVEGGIEDFKKTSRKREMGVRRKRGKEKKKKRRKRFRVWVFAGS